MADGVFCAALAQMRSGRDQAANIAQASALIREAAARGAQYIQTPENTGLMERDTDALIAQLRPEAETAALVEFCRLADELGVWLHVGSLAVKVGERRAANRSFLITPKGAVVARYDKIHMFDVDLPGGEAHRESAIYQPGARAVIARLPWGPLGFTTCYDLRFPEQYRALAVAGAMFISVPSAFTQYTGEAHWHVLLRARAIETGSYVLAAAQGGRHEAGRTTYGHSLIVSPWGEVLAEAGADPCVVTAMISPARVADVRARIPVLAHSAAFEAPPPLGGDAR
ncbi:MAG: carbon-nitrogen hydrolase family protein [Hyphomicrobiales bacterium]|nr:carbon-nitrogen hydrolase family protein [Hyphomicrobiales bacterium]